MSDRYNIPPLGLFGKRCRIKHVSNMKEGFVYRIVADGIRSNVWKELPFGRVQNENVRHNYSEDILIVVCDTLIDDTSKLERVRLKDVEIMKEPQPNTAHFIFTKTMFDKYGCTAVCSFCHKKWKTYDEIRFKKEHNFCPNCGKKGRWNKMNLNSTREEFEKLDYFEPTHEFNGVVIIPTNELHESGYGCMKFALTYNGDVVGCVSGWSDVIHLNGIGGYGKYNYDEALKTDMVKRIDWSIDCLPNGLIRVFCSHKLDIDELICSDFNLYVK